MLPMGITKATKAQKATDTGVTPRSAPARGRQKTATASTDATARASRRGLIAAGCYFAVDLASGDLAPTDPQQVMPHGARITVNEGNQFVVPACGEQRAVTG